MPPKPITKTPKVSKKRKLEDPSQPKLDYFYQKNDPMQIDSSKSPSTSDKPPTLGSIRQQLIVPKVTIVNFSPSRHSELPPTFIADAWKLQKDLILAVFSNSTTHMNYAAAARLCENLCRYGKAEELYERLKSEIEVHVKHMQASLSVQDDALLEKLNTQWESLCHHLSIIRNVFMELDRYYVLSTTKYASILQLGIDIFRETVMSSVEFRRAVILQTLKLIEQDRDGIDVNKQLIKDILHMLQELKFYKSDFESTFLEHTVAYYKQESNRLLNTLSVWDYIHHAYKRQQEETETRISHYLNIQTKHPLLNAVTDQLVYQNVNAILNRGFEEMMNKKMYDTLSTLYALLLNNSNMSLLRASFGEYIKNYGVALIKDPKKDASMVTSLLDFKKELDQILQNCFQNDTTFTNALKEGFEYFINTRQNKPAEMIAKYLDTRLKAPAKKQARTSDDDVMTTVDYVLTLFRFVQGKDAFEAYYKRHLAKRLLLERSLSMEAECQVVEKLKSQCGHEFTKNFETMLKDIHVSFDLIQDFKEKSQYPIYVKVITQAVWPSYSTTSLTLSPEMIKCQEAYHQFYASRFKGRKLIWQNSLSSCVLIAHFPKETKELSMSLPQAAVLLLFNRLDKPTWTVNEIKEATSLEDSELSRTLLSLSTGSYAVLIKVEGGSGPLAGTDTFQFNTDFEAAGVRLKIPAIQQEQTVEEKKEVESKVLVNRQHQLEAAIVRIMKANKTLSQEDLLNQVFQQVRFPVNVTDFKRRVESLIERDYLMRDPSDNSMFVYQS